MSAGPPIRMSADLPIQMFERPKGHHRAALQKTSADEGVRVPMMVRLPPELVKHLDACAHAGYRSRNAEIQRRLEASMVNEAIDEHGVIVVHASPSLK